MCSGCLMYRARQCRGRCEGYFGLSGQYMSLHHPRECYGVFEIRVTPCVGFFFFQAEDGIRDYKVTGVQTCALPIYAGEFRFWDLGEHWKKLIGLPFVYALWLIRPELADAKSIAQRLRELRNENLEIGRASCRERV